MIYLANSNDLTSMPRSLAEQACVRSVLKSDLPPEIKGEMKKFILRNVIPECGKVSPNCLKAHLINVSQRMGLSKNKIERLKNLFKSRIGFKGYYLDSDKVKKVDYR